MTMGWEGFSDRYSRDYGIPVFHREWYISDRLKADEKERRMKLRRETLTTILSEYPTTPTTTLSRETGVYAEAIKRLAKEYGLVSARQASGRKSGRKVEKVDETGKVVAVFSSVNECAKREGFGYHKLRHCGEEGVKVGKYTYYVTPGRASMAQKAELIGADLALDEEY